MPDSRHFAGCYHLVGYRVGGAHGCFSGAFSRLFSVFYCADSHYSYLSPLRKFFDYCPVFPVLSRNFQQRADPAIIPAIAVLRQQEPGKADGSYGPCLLCNDLYNPSTFSRIIVLVLIFGDFWDKIGLKDPLRSTLFFLLFVYSAVLNMTMRRRDLILNHAMLTMGGVSISEGDWLRAMALPTLVFTALVTLLFLAVFRRELKDFHPPASDILAVSTEKLSRKDLRNLLVILLVVVLWALEDLHGISGTVIVTLGTAVLFPLGLLHLSDLRTINVKLLVFLTAAFSIGGVLKAVGVADVLFQQLATLFPETFSLRYVALVLGISMAMHMLLGSNVTTMSVVVPGLMAAGAGVTAEPVLLLLIYLGICGHFLFPFHHVLLLLGEGDGCYTSLQTFRLGLPLTLVTLLCGMFLYLGWWRLIGLF